MGRRALTAPALITAACALAAGCGGADDDFGNAPGANARAGDVLVRYAHLEDPEDADLYEEGADVPLFVWFLNEGDEAVELADVSAELAADVSLTDGDLPLELPVGELVEMGPDDTHLVLEDINTQIRGQELVPVELTFSDGSTVTVDVEAIEVDPSELDL